MRKIFNLIVWISSLSILLLSCSKDETEDDKKPNDDNNMVTVSLGLTGDILEVEESPLSKATETADIYGVQIYSSPKDEDNYEPYGSGIFLDKSKMQVKLFKDRKYKLEMTVFPDGEIGGYESGKYVLTGYKGPFYGYVEITDSIKYNNEYELGLLSSCWVDGEVTTYQKSGNRMPTERYYGKLIDYIPSENNTANIDLKRVVAGLTFNIKGLTNQSTLKIEIEESPTIDIKGDGVTDELTYNSLMCLRGESIGQYEYNRYFYTDKWFENPVDEVPFKFTWTNGERTESFTQTVTLKRKMNYTFQITVPETFLLSNSINVTEEEATWDDNVMVDNIYFGDLNIENEEDLRAFKEANYTKVTGDLIFKYWDSNIIMEHCWLNSIGGDLKFIASDKCPFNDFEGNLPLSVEVIGGNFELIAIAPRCFCNLLSFKGFDAKIEGNFRLIGTQWSFAELYSIYSGIKEIGGSLEISTSNSDSFNRFFEIGNYQTLEKIGGDIILKNLPAFKNYCDLKTVLQNHTGQLIVSGNAYNPTKEQILAGECSKQSE